MPLPASLLSLWLRVRIRSAYRLVRKRLAQLNAYLAEVLLETSRDFQQALDLMKEVIVLGGQRARYYVTLGDIFLSMKEPGRAQDAFKKALRLEPNNKEIQKRIK